ncbi:hypothetical protein FRC04_001670 [Tulasnella sp. 424]|nr:hypothetical protein FRC04_001670 [Tulasnella sp. 424]
MIYGASGWGFNGDLQDVNWDYVMKHTNRVRSLDAGDCRWKGAKNPIISPYAITQIQAAMSKRGWTQLFSNLETLHIFYQDVSTRSSLPLFVTSSLKCLYVSSLFPDQPLRRSIQDSLFDLTEKAGTLRLRELHVSVIQYWESTSEFTEAVTSLVASQPSLHTLRLNLKIRGEPLGTALANIVSLKSLLVVGHLDTEAEIHAVLELIPMCPDLEEVLAVEVFHALHMNVTPTHYVPLPRSWLNSHRLKTVKCTAIDVTTLSPHVINEMGQAWPLLERLELVTYGASSEKRGIPPWLVRFFAAAFPETLVRLGIVINFTVKTEPHYPPVPSRFSKLDVLAVGPSHIEPQDMRSFAELVSTLVPRGARVVCHESTEGDVGKRWKQVNDMVGKEGFNGGAGGESELDDTRILPGASSKST